MKRNDAINLISDELMQFYPTFEENVRKLIADIILNRLKEEGLPKENCPYCDWEPGGE